MKFLLFLFLITFLASCNSKLDIHNVYPDDPEKSRIELFCTQQVYFTIDANLHHDRFPSIDGVTKTYKLIWDDEKFESTAAEIANSFDYGKDSFQTIGMHEPYAIYFTRSDSSQAQDLHRLASKSAKSFIAACKKHLETYSAICSDKVVSDCTEAQVLNSFTQGVFEFVRGNTKSETADLRQTVELQKTAKAWLEHYKTK